jgi:hypothetical protein
MSQSAIAIVVEYFIQNEPTESSISKFSHAGSNPSYPNIYILKDKYRSVADVKIGDVLRSFPLSGSLGTRTYANLHFRFETCLYNSLTQVKLACFRDVYCPDEATLAALNDVPVPTFKDRIRLKVLVLPEEVPKKHIAGIDYEVLHAIHSPAATPKDAATSGSGLTGLLNNLSDKAHTTMKSGIIDHDVKEKLSSAAKEIGDVLNNFGASMFGGSNKK